MRVCLLTDEGYAMQTGVCLASLLRHDPDPKSVFVSIIDNGISEESKKKLNSIAFRYGVTIEYIDPGPVLREIAMLLKNPTQKYISSMTRAFLPELIGCEVEKLIVLDSDLLVLDSLREIWDVSDESMMLGAVVDCLPRVYGESIGLCDSSVYFNTGVQVMNLKAMRSGTFFDKLRFLLDSRGLVDQDIFNIACEGFIQKLPLRYNTITQNRLFSNSSSLLKFTGYSETEYYSINDIKLASLDPAVVHFTTSFVGRPWFTNCIDPKAAEWLREWRETPWGGCSLSSEVIEPVHAACRFAWRLMPEKFFLPLYMLARRRTIGRVFSAK